MATLCLNCGIDLERDEDVIVGDLRSEYRGLTEWKGRRVKLTPYEAMVLHALARVAGRWLTAEALVNIVGAEGNGRSLAVLICRIRQKFRELEPGFDRLESERGHGCRGYRWRG